MSKKSQFASQFPARLDVSDLRALRATARVCGLGGLGVVASVVGCAGAGGEGMPRGGQVASTFEASGGETTKEQKETPDRIVAEVEPASPPTQAPAAPAPKSAAEQLEACRQLTAATPSLKGKPAFDGPKAPEDVLTCCQRIAEDYDTRKLDGLHTWAERGACCMALEWRGSMACTPWGPTAPPAARGQATPPRANAQLLDLRESPSLRAQALRLSENWSRLGLDDPNTLRAAQDTWRARMINEWVSARVFWQIADQMRAAAFPRELVARWHEFGAEERLHGRNCAAVVHALGGDASAPLPALESVPRHADVDLRQGVLRNVLSVSCMSETVAVALIGAERERMPAGLLRELLTDIYAQEVGHARAGWRLLREQLSPLADPQGARRADLRAYVPVALEGLYAHELAHLPAAFVSPPQGERWGLCSGAQARQLLSTTVRELIAPGLQELLA